MEDSQLALCNRCSVQSSIHTLSGKEAKQQLQEKEGVLPDCVVACVCGGSNAMGMFYDFIPNKSVRLVGAEAAGKGVDTK